MKKNLLGTQYPCGFPSRFDYTTYRLASQSKTQYLVIKYIN